MPELFIFLLKVNIALVVFCLGYYLVLRQLTFYTLNRVYLVLSILCASLYPLVDIPALLQHKQLASVQQIAINWQTSATQLAEEPAYWTVLTYLFWAGLLVFAARLTLQLASLYRLYRGSIPAVFHDHEVRVTKANISPFSFWQNIYINPDNIEPADLENVLRHEQVHVNEWHTLDILLAELSVVAYWFNPGVWLMKKAVRENVEFITDRKILQQGADSKAYQYSLLHVSTAETASAAITNHFNFLTLKKRIKMMNAKRSSNLNLTRYAFLVPSVFACLFIVGISKAEVVKTQLLSLKSNAQVSASNYHIEQTDTPKKNKKITAVRISKRVDTVKPKTITILKKKGDTTISSIVISDMPKEMVMISDGKIDSTRKEFGVSYSYTITSDPVRPKVIDVKLTEPASQAEFKDKLILINGEIATSSQLKKLPVSDIQAVRSVDANAQDSSDGIPYIKKYGDKAKNGVIFITTKKSK
ncbi:M56 family metallopeptidase [Pedobacter sp. PWIIR3]